LAVAAFVSAGTQYADAPSAQPRAFRFAQAAGASSKTPPFRSAVRAQVHAARKTKETKRADATDAAVLTRPP
jgi:hypothetical protein